MKGILPALVLTVLIGQLINSVSGTGIFALVFQMITVSLTYIVLIRLIGLNSSEKEIFGGYGLQITKKIKSFGR